MGAAQKIPLTTGAYQSRSLIASAQRCVNLYMENNPKDSPFPTTHYPTPGLITLGTAPNASGWRQLFVASNSQCYGVAGNTVYQISSTYICTAVGSIASVQGYVSMVDNGVELVIVDGSVNGFQVILATGVFSQITDPSFAGSSRVDFVDTYLVFNNPSIYSQWYISLSSVTTFDPLYFASKQGYSDALVCCIVTKRLIWLLGTQTSEVWANSGASDFPFQIIDGIFEQHGCLAVGSVAQMDGSIYLLAQDAQGQAMVMQTVGYNMQKISTNAIDFAIQSYPIVSDAIGFTYQRDGHLFYVLNFPTADKTWVYDLASQQWHERAWIDSNGQFHRHRANCCVSFQGVNLVGDWQNGNLYSMDPNTYTDFGGPIVRVRSFPHMVDTGNRVKYSQFLADFEVGDGQGDNSAPPVSLRWSDDKGATYGNRIEQSLGAEGQYQTTLAFQPLGIARDRVFELSWSTAARTALNGAFIKAQPAN